MSENTFKAFVPIDIIEKGKRGEDGLPEELIIGGVASTAKLGFDRQNQMLDMNGFDVSPLLERGFIDLEHQYNKTHDASVIVGEPIDAHVDKDGDLHLQGRLFKSQPKAIAMYKLAQALQKSGSKRRVGYSIEGGATAFDPKDKRIVRKGFIKNVTLTLSPICNGTEMTLIKGGNFEYEPQEGTDLLVDVVADDMRYTVDKDFNININKAMEAGHDTGRDTTDKASTGDALKEESLDEGDRKKKKKDSDTHCLTKAEVFYDLISRFNYDIESCNMVFDLAEKIEKGFLGLGSRGGKIIGHTKSGKPIYDSHDHPSHKKFNSHDHSDAQEHHLDHAIKTKDEGEKKKHMDQWSGHETAGRKKHLKESYRETIEKGGEGSRGGKVIGHTRSGKAIYDSHDHVSHKNFTADDHSDAESVHVKLSHKHANKAKFIGDTSAGQTHKHLSDQHKQHSLHHQKLRFSGESLQKGGEGSRGGKVIGHTKSGKPIYDSYKHKEHKNFDVQDHKDAMGVNAKHAYEASEQEHKHRFTDNSLSHRMKVIRMLSKKVD